MININYQKRKNTELFKSFESFDFSQTQNYIPIYGKFFSLNEANYNNINLNHNWYLHNIKENSTESQNLFKCAIHNLNTNKVKNKQVFFKLAPLVDPFKYLIGKYNPNDSKLYNLPFIASQQDNSISNSNFNSKFLDVNNSAYVDGFFSFLNSKLIHEHNFIHGVDFYGSFLSIKNNFTLNIFDDIDYLNKSDYFNKNKNVLFQVDDYSFLLEDDEEENKKLPNIKIDHNNSARSILSIKSIDDSMFENVFANEVVSLDDLKGDGTLSLIGDLQIQTNLTTTLKSGSSCSSRSSHTDPDNENTHDCCTDEGISNNQNSSDSEGDREVDDEGYEPDDKNSSLGRSHSHSDSDETGSDESTYTEEKINVVIPKFPVQIICMEKCETTFDDLILNEELSEMEWYSAFMQIIMILITYQKMFAFTHNDLHTNNIMYNETKEDFIYYCYKKKYYKVPTFGRVFKIIDFGRSIYKFNGKLFCSDSFQQGGDAATQYNTEPYFNDKKPRLEPNYSFDLCRLACSIFDYMIEDLESIKNLDECDPVVKLIVEWCLDDKGINLMYKNDGTDRYPDFKLYKMIARCVHKHTPQAQLERDEFAGFAIAKNKVPATASVMNIDEYPTYI